MEFKLWLEDIFGFEKEPAPLEEPDDLPIIAFDANKLMNFVSKIKIGEYQSKNLIDSVVWGNHVGAIRVRLQPILLISIQRLCADLEGKPFWITKKLFKIKRKFAGQEDIVAHEIKTYLQKISKEQIDSGSTRYDKLFALTKKIYERVNKANRMFVQQGIKKIADNNYNILLAATGYGQGQIVAPSRNTSVSAGIISVVFYPNTGIIKTMFYTVSVEEDSNAWMVDVPYFIGEFLPSQPEDEIVDATINGIKFI